MKSNKLASWIMVCLSFIGFIILMVTSSIDMFSGCVFGILFLIFIFIAKKRLQDKSKEFNKD